SPRNGRQRSLAPRGPHSYGHHPDSGVHIFWICRLRQGARPLEYKPATLVVSGTDTDRQPAFASGNVTRGMETGKQTWRRIVSDTFAHAHIVRPWILLAAIARSLFFFHRQRALRICQQ